MTKAQEDQGGPGRTDRMLAVDELSDAVLLVFVNQQDLPNAMNAADHRKGCHTFP